MALEAFLKQNKKEQKTILYPASESFVDENGRPMMWKLRPLGRWKQKISVSSASNMEKVGL